MKTYFYNDNVFSFEGSVSVQVEKDWVMPWRIDCRVSDFFPVLADGRGQDCSGVRLCFETDTVNLELDVAEHGEYARFDLFVDNVFNHSKIVKDEPRVVFDPLPKGMKKVEIWLDQRFPLKLRSVTVDEDSIIRKAADTRKRWVHYGSSISQSHAADYPCTTWPSLVSQQLDLHLTNLGFSGECKIEPMMGIVIRDLPADFITLKMGINVHGGGLTDRTFGPNVIGLIQLIREKHPYTPLAVISPIYSPPREVVKGGSALSLQDMRKILSDIVDSCIKYGDENIYYIDGLKIFGAEDIEFLPDELHPSAQGQYVMAHKFIKEVFGRFSDL